MFKPEGLEDMKPPISNGTEFVLAYNILPVGILSYSESLWHFEYTKQFKDDRTISPLTEFPDVNKIYTSAELFPFFMHRIPSPSQPNIKEIINKERLNEHNLVEMLKRFGRLTITNPFELEFKTS